MTQQATQQDSKKHKNNKFYTQKKPRIKSEAIIIAFFELT